MIRKSAAKFASASLLKVFGEIATVGSYRAPSLNPIPPV
jgi:hypothetical protein